MHITKKSTGDSFRHGLIQQLKCDQQLAFLFQFFLRLASFSANSLPSARWLLVVPKVMCLWMYIQWKRERGIDSYSFKIDIQELSIIGLNWGPMPIPEWITMTRSIAISQSEPISKTRSGIYLTHTTWPWMACLKQNLSSDAGKMGKWTLWKQ